MSRVAFAVGLAVLLVTTVARAQDLDAVPDDRAADAPAVEVHDERLTLDADEVPLATILARLATAAKIAFELRGEAEEPMSAHLVAVPLEDGLQRLLKGRNTLFVYDDQGARTPSVVYVLGRRTRPPEVPPTLEAETPPEAETPDEATTEEEGSADPEVEDVGARALEQVSTLEEELDPEPTLVSIHLTQYLWVD